MISNAQVVLDFDNQITCFKFHRETNVLYAQLFDANEQRYYLSAINPITGALLLIVKDINMLLHQLVVLLIFQLLPLLLYIQILF